ncbi:hypothetical protein [Pyxidicoccus xibeiensis]|uniref:hypothetical protein n=1 Tax=Pyxidicoccus xibeiensis TaxID=2906759 RepID=UPI0020A7B629|nr:hypothetical protein [Pyxidicoccus xibeiensis]MCP3139756.1 hypothetical protein [Pyxidicoccus xibeiensis]
MSRLIWSVGGTGLLLSALATAWLHRPLEPRVVEAPMASAPHDFTAETPDTHAAPAPPPTTPRQQARGASIPPPEHPASPPADLSGLDAPRPPPGSALPRERRQVSEPRLRLVKALRGDYPTPEARRAAVLAELAASGASGEPWTEDARAALERWKTRVDEDVLPVRAEPPRCFAAGCVSRVTFPDAASFDVAFQGTAELRLGTASAHLQLPPERLASGEVVASWVVLRPDAP